MSPCPGVSAYCLLIYLMSMHVQTHEKTGRLLFPAAVKFIKIQAFGSLNAPLLNDMNAIMTIKPIAQGSINLFKLFLFLYNTSDSSLQNGSFIFIDKALLSYSSFVLHGTASYHFQIYLQGVYKFRIIYECIAFPIELETSSVKIS